MTIKKNRNILLYSDTRRSADALYFGGIDIFDPFIAFSVRGRKYAVMKALDFGLVKRTSHFDAVLRFESCLERARRVWPNQKAGPALVIALLFRELEADVFTISDDFPISLYKELCDLKVRVEVSADPLIPDREVKAASEAAAIRDANRCCAAGFGVVERLLRASKVRGRRLLYRGKTLTSEQVKVAIEVACIEAGSVSNWTIVAGGDQACDPNYLGSGPLHANELIVVDFAPRVSSTGYHGDMTRTFLRGRASDAQRAIVEAVRTAQIEAFRMIRPGVKGMEVHRKVTETFRARGFETRHTLRGSVGFFHGTGHGIGLEIHEQPLSLNASAGGSLRKGSVITVEPGLYYPGVGGCRLEDVVQVVDGPPRMLSRYHYTWELR